MGTLRIPKNDLGWETMNKFLRVNVTENDRCLLEEVCEARGETLSNFVRRTLRKELAEMSYYPPDVKKALGIAVNQGGV